MKFNYFFLVAGILAFFIPNIRDIAKGSEISHVSTDHRQSITSLGR